MNTWATVCCALIAGATLWGCTDGAEPLRHQPVVEAPRSKFAPYRLERIQLSVPTADEINDRYDEGAFKPYRDPKTGKTWRLFFSWAMGRCDLWLAEKVNGHWVNPIFTGIVGEGAWFEETSGLRKKDMAKAEPHYRQLLIRCLTRLPELTRDSDGDGLTDLEEETRTFTDPHNPDTNHSGIPDGRDPWPNVVSRPLSEAEWLLATAFKRAFRDDTNSSLEFFFGPDDCVPFTMPGRKGPTIWISKTRAERFMSEAPFQDWPMHFEELNPDAKGADKCIAWCSPFITASVRLDSWNSTFLVDFEKRKGAWVISNFQEEIADPPMRMAVGQ